MFYLKLRGLRGFTLIELMVVMAIVAALFVVGAVGLRSVFQVSLKNTSKHLASTLRYLSSKAVTEHVYLRVAYDLEGESYFVEESREPFLISTEPAENKGPKKGKEGEGEGEGFAQVETRLLKPTKLPSGVFFKDVSVSYTNQKMDGGKAYTYFFPDGFATATVVNFRDEKDEEHYSVELLPLSGRVKVKGEYGELERK